MGFFSMFTKAFAVIAGNNNDGVVVDASFFQKCDPIRKRGIGICDFAVIEMIFIFLREGWRRLIRIVRII